MTIVLYELVGAEETTRFSPFCWRARLALEHKGLAFETVPIRFSDKALLTFSGQDKVPVIKDGDKVVSDSWEIANYLEDTYPDRPTLFPDGDGRSLTRFVTNWVDTALHPILAPLLTPITLERIAECDRAYFRESREQRFGKRLEELSPAEELVVRNLRTALAPLNRTLSTSPFLAGDAPGYADIALMGSLMWVRSLSAIQYLMPDDPAYAWREGFLRRLGADSARLFGYDWS